MKAFLLVFIFSCFSLFLFAQQKTDTLFTDIDPFTLQPSKPHSSFVADSERLYVKKVFNTEKSIPELQIIKNYGRFSMSRQAALDKKSFGTVIAFKRLRTTGRACIFPFLPEILIYHDSILIDHDTIFYKQILASSEIRLYIVYPPSGDTITIQKIFVPYRHKNLKKKDLQLLLMNHRQWPGYQYSLYTAVYTLIRSGSNYELINILSTLPTGGDSDVEYMNKKFQMAGLSPFLLAIADIEF